MFFVAVLAIISVIVFISVSSFEKYIPTQCNDEEKIAEIYKQMSVINFLKDYPDAGFVVHEEGKIHDFQCQYWFYHNDGTVQNNLWVITGYGKMGGLRSRWTCFDNDTLQPIVSLPHDMNRELTVENCDPR